MTSRFRIEQAGQDAADAPAAADAAALQIDARSIPPVTIFCWLYAPFPGGGADRVMQQVAEFLVRHGGRVSVFTKALKGVPRRDVVNGVQVQRIFTLEVPLVRYLSFMALACLRQLLRRDPGQVLHANQFHLQVPPSLLVTRLRRMGLVVGVHGSGVLGDVQRLGRLPLGLGGLILRIGRGADAVISLTDHMTEELTGAGIPADRVVLIPNGVDCERFAPVSSEHRAELRAQCDFPPDRPVVLFAARLAYPKAVDVLLRSWKLLHERCPEALLVLAGTGALKEEMETLSHELGLDDAVRFLGWVEATRPLYQAADLFVQPSWSEGMSMSLLEAMASGLTPVVTAIPGNTDVVTQEHNGLLIQPGDEEGLAAALERGLRDVALRARLASAARETIQSRYSAELMNRRYAHLYQQVWEQRQQKQKRYEI
ncbi:MAG TPA: glycosyltransferase family 4 protein [Ktedonobacterales bacterium]|nr:glycosyltransferase family 4 protein [Ktedonobacterales bacterium]